MGICGKRELGEDKEEGKKGRWRRRGRGGEGGGREGEGKGRGGIGSGERLNSFVIVS